MLTWGEVRAALAARLRVEHDQPGWIGVLVEDVLVRVEEVTAREAPWLLLLSLVCYERDLPHRDALAMNLRIACGALALNGDRVELRHAMPLAAARAAELAELVVELAHEARLLTAEVGGRARAATLFSTLTE
jgi:hypothetical protein